MVSFLLGIYIDVCVLEINLASQPLLAFAAPPSSEALPSHASNGSGGDSGGGRSGKQASGEHNEF